MGGEIVRAGGREQTKDKGGVGAKQEYKKWEEQWKRQEKRQKRGRRRSMVKLD
jgi:hypothetical protein